MDAVGKLRLLGPATRFEPAEEVTGSGRAATPVGTHDLSECIYRAVMPGGKRIALLKTLLTSACERDCRYCPFRQGRDFQRATFGPNELAHLFMQMHQSGLVQGIFLSSAIAGGGVHTEDRLIGTAEILRHKYDFQGYLHLKIMPGAERDQIKSAMQLADRVSVNLEAPNSKRLTSLAPHKAFNQELLQRLQWVEEIRREKPGRWPSSTTQFVVGAGEETDVELLTTTEFLYQTAGLSRTYFMAFKPVDGTPLEDRPATPPEREYRLYQASFLLRDYGFSTEDLPFGCSGNLPLDIDPKLAWARQNLMEAPIEINTASHQELLRIPGIGPKGAARIIGARHHAKLRHLSSLSKLGIATRRSAPFILLDGRRSPRQLRLWSP